jgi:glycosyltransferase involved in cell wall biosynthesis
VAEAVQSILRQTYGGFELIIIDDASTDGSQDDLAGFANQDSRIKLLRNPENLGLTRSLNRGLQAASGEFIARQDADDVSLPRRLEKQIAAMDASPDLALLGTGVCEINRRGKKGAVIQQPSLTSIIKRKMLFDNAFFHTSVMWRKDSFDRQQLIYDKNLRYSQDYDLFSRAVWLVKSSNLLEPLVLFRIHPGQVSKQRVEDQQTLADATAWRNFQAFGLGAEFGQGDVALMRKLGIRSNGLAKDSRLRQWRLWQKLFSLLEADLLPDEQAEWTPVKQVRLYLLRRTLAARPPLWRELAALLATDTLGAAKDLAGVMRNRLVGKGA